MTAPRAPRLFTIPPGQPFLATLAKALLGGGFPTPDTPPPDPLTLAGYTLLVPTRRAARALADAFLEAADGAALLLPRIRPIGDVEEDELALDTGEGGDALDLSPAVGALERRLLLARAICDSFPRRDDAAGLTPAQALRLAGDLAALIDGFETEGVGYDGLAGLVTDEFAGHWAQTLEFLKLITERYPRELEERALMGAAERRNRLLAAEAARLAAAPPAAPVIAAGSTGTIPATADLLAAVARLPQGAVVLPGLDTRFDEAAWASLAPGHPQFAMKALLARIGATRDEVAPLPGAGAPAAAPDARFRLLEEALRPAETTDAWARRAEMLGDAELTAAVDGVTLIAAASPREEATVIALILRRALETPGRTAALVTPDRALARQVAAELARWSVEADDSAGEPLRATPPARLALLLAEAVASGLAPVPLLALLKHPMARFGLDPAVRARALLALECAVLRGVRPAPGIDGLNRALAAARGTGDGVRRHRTVRRLASADWRAADRLLERLAAATAPLAPLRSADEESALEALLTAHVAALEAVAAAPRDGVDHAGTGEGGDLWADDAGELFAGLLAETLQSAASAPPLRGADYPAFFDALLAGAVVRPRYRRHPRITILGLLEARLIDADVMVLGGLNEATWPPVAQVDAWLNRPMREQLGLPAPERRIGLTAHDFVQAACARRVFLTRAEKADGAPTVPSRWLLRLEALLGERAGELAPSPDEDWIGWARGLDDAGTFRPVPPPRPAPPLAVRPQTMSVTRVETWIRDPYAIFARDILALDPLDPLDADPGAAERGTIIHDALARFTAACPGALPDDALARLLAVGEEVFADLIDRPAVKAVWWPRFCRAAAWFVAQEAVLRDRVARQLTEVSGATEIAAAGEPFTLNARADRIDVLADGRLRIVDYKTGQLPSQSQVEAALSPQLPLEAVIALDGGFQGLAAADIAELVYIGLQGGELPGVLRRLEDPAQLAEDARAGLARRVARFRNPATPYVPRAAAEFERFAYDFDHLSRHGEWSLAITGAETP